MQAPKSRSSISPAGIKSKRPLRAAGSESSSNSDTTPTKSPNRSSSKIDRRSPVNSDREKKRPTKLTELEFQLSHLQEELKKTKDQLISSELSKKRAHQETDETKKQLLFISSKLKESECQLAESSSVEESRILELRKLSQERDRAWQSELEAVQKQHSMDSAQLVSAMNEMHKLRAQVREGEKERDELREMLDEVKQELEISRGTIDSLLTDGSKLMDSFGLVVAELEESRARVNTLEEMVGRFGNEKNVGLDVEELRMELEKAETKWHEGEILRIVETNCAYELVEQIKIEINERESKLESAVNSARSEVIMLKANLFDKDNEIKRIMDMNKKLEAESNMGLNVTRLEQQLMEKERTLERALQENDQLKQGMEKFSAEKDKISEEAARESKLSMEKEGEIMKRLELAVEETNESNKRETIVREQLESVRTTKEEMEGELRRLRVQAQQWKKAAEAAMALLAMGNGNKEKFIERSESLDSNSFFGKFGNLTFSDELDEEGTNRKNGSVLRRIGGIWKK